MGNRNVGSPPGWPFSEGRGNLATGATGLSFPVKLVRLGQLRRSHRAKRNSLDFLITGNPTGSTQSEITRG